MTFALLMSSCSLLSGVAGIHTVKLDLDGGENAKNFVIDMDGKTAKLPTPTREVYVFDGWYTDEELTDRYFFDYSFDTATTFYAKFYDTSIGEYIVISNVEQLMAISEQPAAKYLLACDINCKGETLTPIDEFTGELEGNGYKIFNFSLTEDAANVGFIRTNKGTINDLSFADFVFDTIHTSSGAKYYGVICGINDGYINNCHTLDSELKIIVNINGVGATPYTAGLVGYNNGELNGCSNNSSIVASFNATGYSSFPSDHNGSVICYIAVYADTLLRAVLFPNVITKQM